MNSSHSVGYPTDTERPSYSNDNLIYLTVREDDVGRSYDADC
jgi:hypothetical protein